MTKPPKNYGRKQKKTEKPIIIVYHYGWPARFGSRKEWIEWLMRDGNYYKENPRTLKVLGMDIEILEEPRSPVY